MFNRLRSKRDPVHRGGSGVPQSGGNGLLLDLLRSKRDPFDREGYGVPQNGGNRLVLERYGRNGGLFIGRGVAYRKTEETDLCWSATVEMGVLFIGRGVAYPKTGLHVILFISTVDCLHGLLFIHRPPPPASTCDYSSTGSYSSSLHCSSIGYCSTNPLHWVLFIHPNRLDQGPVHPAAMASTTTGSCSSNPPSGTVHPNPPTTLTVHHGKEAAVFDRLQLAAVPKESLDRVQLIGIDRSLGFSNA